MERRTFLSTTAALGASASLFRGAAAPEVTAESTVFFAPDGESNLVRFSIAGLEAPAGRLRVYDRRSRLVGTAGVINTGQGLVGELWLRLEQDLTLTSELEAPGLSGVHRTTHHVPQGLRWTIHWLIVADPEDVQRVIGTDSPLANALRTSVAQAATIQINPLSGPYSVAVDPLQALEPFRRAQALAALGFPTSPVAYHPSFTRLDQITVMSLTGAGVRYVMRPWDTGATYEWWDGLDGSQILAIPQAPNGDLGSLGFDDTSATAQRRVAAWLATSPIHLAPLDARGGETKDRVTYIIDTDVERAPARKLAIDDWNARFGFPRLVMGAPENPLDVAHQSRESIPNVRTTYGTGPGLTAAIGARGGVVQRSANLLAAVLTNGRRGIEAVAADVRTEFPGTIVFNGAPFPRTDAMVVAGQRQIVTNIPAHGYAFLPNLGDESPAPRPGSNSPIAQSARHLLRVDDRDGSIDSIVDRESALEWVGEGMNIIDGARLDRLTQDVLPGMGIRIIAERQVPRIGRVRSTIELLDMVPWISIRNEHEGDATLETRFQFADSAVEALWDRGFGHHQSALPTPLFEFARWVWLRSRVNGYFWSTIRQGRVTQSSMIVSQGDAGASFRLMADSLPASPADAARFGWRTIDLIQHPVAPNPRGRLPRFGSLLALDQPSAAILAIEPDDAFATSATVYVQDLLGAARMLGIEQGILNFDDAEVVDYLGRPRDQNIEASPNGVRFLTQRFGITAVRLRGLQLRET